VVNTKLFDSCTAAAGRSRAELARRAGMHPSTISFAESGRFHLSTAQIAKLVQGLGAAAAALLKDNPPGGADADDRD
jgi:transcriptional regulator with XRE-family HTH domain